MIHSQAIFMRILESREELEKPSNNTELTANFLYGRFTNDIELDIERSSLYVE